MKNTIVSKFKRFFTYKKINYIIIFIFILLIFFKLDTFTYSSSNCEINRTHNVCLDDYFIFTIEGRYDGEPRNKIISEHLKRIAESKAKNINSINDFKIKTNELTAVIYLDGEVIVTVKESDAKKGGENTPTDLAKDHREKIFEAFQKYQKQDPLNRLPKWITGLYNFFTNKVVKFIINWFLIVLGTFITAVFSLVADFNGAEKFLDKYFPNLAPDQRNWIDLILILLLCPIAAYFVVEPETPRGFFLAGMGSNTALNIGSTVLSKL